jgi:hypothetical protein
MAETDSFWGVVRHKVIVVSTMDRDVRITFAAGASIVAAATLLNILRPDFGSPVHSVAGAVPLSVLLLLTVGELIVMTMFFTGVMSCRGRVRLAALAAVTVITAFYLWLADFAPAAFLLVIPTALLWWLAALTEQHQWPLQKRVLAAAGNAAVTAIILALFAATGAQELVVSALATQATFAMFGLFMAATDTAELIVIGSQALVGALTSLSASRAFLIPFMLATAVVSVVVTLWMSVPSGAPGLDSNNVAILLGAIVGHVPWLGLAFWLVVGPARKLGNFAPHLSYRALFLIVLFYFLALQAGLLQRILSDPAGYDPHLMFTFPEIFLLTTLLMLVYIALLFVFGRRSDAQFVHFAYGALVGFFWFFNFASQGDNILLVVGSAGVGSIVFLGVAALLGSTRPRLAQVSARLAEMNISLAAYACIFVWFLTDSAEGGAPLSLWQALFIFALLGWDIVSSGDAITNKHTESFPRIARVCFFFTYIITVSVFVLLASSSELMNPITSAPVEGVFDSDKLIAVGLALFGPAFFFLIFGLRMRGIRQAGPDSDAPRQPDTEMPVPAPAVATSAPSGG